MISTPERVELVKLIQEARQAGARLRPACEVVGISSRTFERWIEEGGVREDRRPGAERKPSPRRLSEEEEQAIVDFCNSPEYASLPPSQIVPDLADKGVYVASESTFYRILRKHKLLRHRGRSKAPQRKPLTTHSATAPNQVWSWDITWLPGPVQGQFFKLYMILDIFSRKTVGWEVWTQENAEHAEELIRKARYREGASQDPLVLHSDNGSPMKAATFQATLASLGIQPSYSRPRVSNDNAFSEAGFKTLKYRPNYPTNGFSSIEHARAWVYDFMNWYNEVHRHSGIGFVTPSERHLGKAEQVLTQRRAVYEAARARHPERWSKKPRAWEQPTVVTLNPERTQNVPEGGLVP